MMSQEMIPSIGFGTWKLKNDEETKQIISNAIDVGYELIDTAAAYLNEEAIGNGLVLKNREKLFISGKLWNSDRDNVIEACKKTISNLKCDYLDLYLMHWPASKAVHEDWVNINNNVWKQMEELVNLGLVKYIGVSNFKPNQLDELLKNANVKPFVNQIEYHPGFMQNDIVSYCKEKQIHVQAWSPLGSGKILKKQEIINIAEKYGRSPAQICIRWCVQNGVIPIVKSKDFDRMKSNIDIWNFCIADEDMEFINSLPYLGGSGLDSETLTLFG